MLSRRRGGQLIMCHSYFGAETPYVNRGLLQRATTLEMIEHRKDFLCFPESKDWNQYRSPLFKSLLKGRQKPLFLVSPRICGIQRTISARSLYDQNIDLLFWKIGAPHQCLLQEVDVPRVEYLSAFCAKQNTC